ncbi:MAG TPA: cytochrome c biogenesis protein CcdA, partial [Gemmataceae bacterium]|nr:cytochrome c biogenesis protein CcdA [Gemmataceae bacterium]
RPRRGQIVRVEIDGTLTDGYNTYPITQRTSQQEPEQLTSWKVEPVAGAKPIWPLHESAPKVGKLLGKSYFKFLKHFSWGQDIFVDENAPGELNVPIKMRIQICNATTCRWFDHTFPVSIDVSDEPLVPMSADIFRRLHESRPSIEVVPIESDIKPGLARGNAKGGGSEQGAIISEGLISDSHEKYKEAMDNIAAQIVADKAGKGDASADLVAFMLAGVFWGAISLITPCVFPMIPITVSFFLKQSEKEHHRPIVMASVYSLTIVVVLTLAAAFLLSIFRMLSIHPITNYFIGGLFVFFALSLFGMYEIELPTSLAQFTSSREGKGGLVGTIFMALTFTIISFACVAPFLGGFSGTAAAARPWWHNLLGGLAFSVTFASPFFFLALFPSLLRKLPKSGSWLNSVKVVMGFLELAAAFKFFRTAELIQTAAMPSFFTFDLVLGLWIAMSVLCGLYLIGAFRLPHDTPEDHITVPRLLFGAVFFGLALYLAPALFKVGAAGQPQRPGGAVYAWVDSFLLPESVEGDAEVTHTANLPYAVAAAREEFKRTGTAKRIFLDCTGVTCTNCKINEKSVFTKSRITPLFEPYIFVKLYTDTVPPKYYARDLQPELASNPGRSKSDAEVVNLPFQKKVFGTEQLPLYVILEPQLDNTIRIISIYDEGRINNEVMFANFLEHPG